MERSTQELELYTIPSYSSWFSWINIHEVERFSLREFFDGSSITRSPRIYKEYRDFIISKYREEPSRKLTFTEVRKSLVGDISVLLKVFTFLEKWGLINFNSNDDDNASINGDKEDENWKGRVKVEEGAPYGVRVVGAPNAMKPLVAVAAPVVSLAADGGGVVGEVSESGFKWAPLASYGDVYGELLKQEEEKVVVVCGSCGGNCDSPHYEYKKEGSLILCENCFKSGNYDKTKSADDFDFKLLDDYSSEWTESETLVLLESVLKHGDDWDLIAKDVQSKNKMDCISKLIQLPLGDLMFGAHKKRKYLDIVGDHNQSKQTGLASEDLQDSTKEEDPTLEVKDPTLEVKDPTPEVKDPTPEVKDSTLEVKDHEVEDLTREVEDPTCEVKDPDSDPDTQIREFENEGPPMKKLCAGPTFDVADSLMKQVAEISSLVGPHVTASAAEAAITALCYENQCSREIFDENEFNNFIDSKAPDEISEQKRAAEVDIPVEDEMLDISATQEVSSLKSMIPLNLRTRAATATALGAASANAKLLADQEEREIEDLVANIIESQIKKLRRKVKYFDELELIMEKENSQIEELEESLIAERLNVLQRVYSAGVTKPKEHALVKHQTDTA